MSFERKRYNSKLLDSLPLFKINKVVFSNNLETLEETGPAMEAPRSRLGYSARYCLEYQRDLKDVIDKRKNCGIVRCESVGPKKGATMQDSCG